MKIAFISTNTVPTPPNPEHLLPGWTRSIADLTHDISEGLIKKGHDVTLFASGNSKTSGKLESIWEKSSVEYEQHSNQFDSFYMSYEHMLINLCFERNLTEKYDIIYTYHAYDPSIYARFCDTPLVTTLHGPGSYHDELIVTKLNKPSYFVSISNKQIEAMPYIKFVSKIPHGVDPEIFTFNEKSNQNLVLVGRIADDKGTDIAVQAAKDLNLKIDLIGTTNYQPLMDKLKQIGGQAEFHGQLAKDDVKDIVSNSKAFIFPIRWDEPFGLVLIESLACGTPIVGFANGSLPEIIDDGKTGFLVNMDNEHKKGDWAIKQTGIEGIKQALQKIYSMSTDEYLDMRKACREAFDKKFTKQIMVDNYEKLFDSIIKGEVK